MSLLSLFKSATLNLLPARHSKPPSNAFQAIPVYCRRPHDPGVQQPVKAGAVTQSIVVPSTSSAALPHCVDAPVVVPLSSCSPNSISCIIFLLLNCKKPLISENRLLTPPSFAACPHCRFQYALTKGGCMHFSCSQCRYQFCSGCNNPYHKVRRRTVTHAVALCRLPSWCSSSFPFQTTCKMPQCTYTALHAHHPRDCLFYLRDWEPDRLQTLLQVPPPLSHHFLFEDRDCS